MHIQSLHTTYTNLTQSLYKSYAKLTELTQNLDVFALSKVMNSDWQNLWLSMGCPGPLGTFWFAQSLFKAYTKLIQSLPKAYSKLIQSVYLRPHKTLYKVCSKLIQSLYKAHTKLKQSLHKVYTKLSFARSYETDEFRLAEALIINFLFFRCPGPPGTSWPTQSSRQAYTKD